jgi:uncharacterized protein DUF1360
MTTEHFFAVIILGIASYRITRFFVIDTLLEPWRSKSHHWLEQRRGLFWSKLYDLTSCTWCIGYWVSLVVYLIYKGDFFDDWTRNDWLRSIAVAGVQGMLHAVEPEEE